MNSLKLIVHSLDLLSSKNKQQSKGDENPVKELGSKNLEENTTSEQLGSFGEKGDGQSEDDNSEGVVVDPKVHENFEIEKDTETSDTNKLEESQDRDDKESGIALKLCFFLFQMIFFFPRYFMYMPILYLWYFLTYPLLVALKVGSPSLQESITEKSETSTNIDEKTELIKRETISANTVKSPSLSSKYIIPPPQRLYPLSRHPGRKRKKILVLDLDETLIHSLSWNLPRSFNGGSTLYRTIEVKINNFSFLYHVTKRPYCDFFLREISKWFELQIFTASVKEYADPIIDWLEFDAMSSFMKKKEPDSDKLFSRRFYRNNCTYRQGIGYIKDLSKFYPKEDDLKNIVILDNSPISYALHEDNAIRIEGWINDQTDRDLVNLLPVLYSLSVCIDVRFILSLRNGEKVFER